VSDSAQIKIAEAKEHCDSFEKGDETSGASQPISTLSLEGNLEVNLKLGLLS